jgi:hypothetical protein
VQVDDAAFGGRFGPWRVETPLSNITAVAVTGPYRWVKTAGPARLAITDRGLTFATAVRGLDPLGLIRHPELTVTVADVNRLVMLLEARTKSVSSD